MKRTYRSKDRPLCFLIRRDGWVYVATVPDVWHDRQHETTFETERSDYDDGQNEERPGP